MNQDNFEYVQGQYQEPALEEGFYYAYLSKVTYNDNDSLIDVVFELVPENFIDLLKSSKNVPAKIPVWIFHNYHIVDNKRELFDLNKASIFKLFKLNEKDRPFAQGSWYYFKIKKYDENFPNDTFKGTVYDPDIDIQKGKEYGTWYIDDKEKSNALLFLPNINLLGNLSLTDPNKKEIDDEASTTAPTDGDRSDDEVFLPNINLLGNLSFTDPNKKEIDDEVLSEDESLSECTKRRRIICNNVEVERDIEDILSNILKIENKFLVANEPNEAGNEAADELEGNNLPTMSQQNSFLSLGVMDVGMGNCNMIINSQGIVISYFDVGYPLWFYISTLNDNMRFNHLLGCPNSGGPIRTTNQPPINIIISHWDWDHWRLGRIAGMNDNNYVWHYRDIPFSPTVQNFLRTVHNSVQVISSTNIGDIEIIRTDINGRNLPREAWFNNTGLAIRIPVGVDNNQTKYVLSTGDANFNTIDVNSLQNLDGVVAVHHGSRAHYASDNLPTPILQHKGLLAYSYGVSPTGNHAYGFPTTYAVNNYTIKGWKIQRSTAEGDQINTNQNLTNLRGNVLLGTFRPNTPNTAFSVFENNMILNNNQP